MVVAVKRGDPLGKVGFSGLRWGRYQEHIVGEQRPVQLDLNTQKSWDEPHVHYEDMWRSQSGDNKGTKGWQRDMYDIYSTAENYPTPTRARGVGMKPLLLLDQGRMPIFTR